jgi:hypothetical protein
MSLFDGVGTYLGTGSVPVIVGGTVYGVFELGEKLASPQAKEALTKWLQTADVRKVVGLPQHTMEIFERVFGQRHFTLECLWRSTAFSLCSLLGIFIILPFFLYLEVIWNPGSGYLWMIFALIVWAILIDYISLYKTRLIFGWFNLKPRRIWMGSIILLIGVAIYIIIFGVGLDLASSLGLRLPWLMTTFLSDCCGLY